MKSRTEYVRTDFVQDLKNQIDTLEKINKKSILQRKQG
jgi:hypothetical protein